MSENTLENRVMHWQRTRNLMIVHLAVWFTFAYLVHLFADLLYQINFFGMPLNYYMAAQGSLIVFVVQLFLFVKQQDKIDREHGVAEDDDMIEDD